MSLERIKQMAESAGEGPISLSAPDALNLAEELDRSNWTETGDEFRKELADKKSVMLPAPLIIKACDLCDTPKQVEPEPVQEKPSETKSTRKKSTKKED